MDRQSSAGNHGEDWSGHCWVSPGPVLLGKRDISLSPRAQSNSQGFIFNLLLHFIFQ